jgi:hypothetical protein
MSDEIILVEKGEIRSLPSRTFREGLLGKTLESGLQELIEQHPQIIPGSQIAPGRLEPPRFTLLCREMSVGSWSLDFLLIDQYGIPTLVEAKLAENPESRRAVVGQIIEYATNASEFWSGGKLREKASNYLNSRGKNIEDVVTQLIKNSEHNEETFWQMVEKNLEEDRLRLIIATDELRPEVRKIIEFLNRETKNIEILGLEIRCYGEDSDFVALVPTIIGQSQAIAEKKASTSQKELWDHQNLHDYYDSMENQAIAKRLKQVLDWAESCNVLITDKKLMQSFSIKGKSGSRLMTFWRRGKVYCFMNPKNYGDSVEERDNFVEELNRLRIFNYNPLGVRDGRTSQGSLDELSDSEFNEFIRILEKYCCEGK